VVALGIPAHGDRNERQGIASHSCRWSRSER